MSSHLVSPLWVEVVASNKLFCLPVFTADGRRSWFSPLGVTFCGFRHRLVSRRLSSLVFSCQVAVRRLWGFGVGSSRAGCQIYLVGTVCRWGGELAWARGGPRRRCDTEVMPLQASCADKP